MDSTQHRIGGSIGRAAWKTSGILVGASLLSGCLLYEWQRLSEAAKAEKNRTIAAVEWVAPQLGPLLAGQSDEPLREWARTLRSNPDIHLVTVYDLKDRLRAVEARNPYWAKKVGQIEQDLGKAPTPKARRLRDPGNPDAWAASVPIRFGTPAMPVGHLTVVTTRHPLESEAAPEWWNLYLPLAGIAIALWCIGGYWIAEQVIKPFRDLAEHSTPIGSLNLLAHEDPFSSITNAFDTMLAEIDKHRSRARTLEQTLDQRVSNKTREYLTQLRKALHEAEVDPLTGLKNRRVLDQHLDKIVASYVRQGPDLTMVMFDMDHFKTFNDTLGHPAGDELLRFAGELMGKSLREHDLALRIGGDEFLLVLPDTIPAQAREIVRRLMALFSQHVKTLPPVKPAPSLSAGIASLQTTRSHNGGELLRAADEALYQAKTGRDTGEHIAFAEHMAAVTG